MNLRKDAMVAVSMAGAVLLIAGISARVGQVQPSMPQTPVVVPQSDAEILEIFAASNQLRNSTWSTDTETSLATARAKSLHVYFSRPLKGPLDQFRVASILETSTDPRELALAHQLAAKAIGAGIEQARETLLRAQDRLLLSLGQPQRYGTQAHWKGLPVESHGIVSPDLSPQVRSNLMPELPQHTAGPAVE